MTNQQIALEIEKLKLDMKPFWEEVTSTSAHRIFNDLLIQPFSYINAFKLELLVIYMNTHYRAGFWRSLELGYINYLTAHSIDYSNLIKITSSTYSNFSKFEINPSKPIPTELILGNLAKPKQYLNTYLKSKLSITQKSSTAFNKILEPNEMALAVFSNWLSRIKSINSVQAIDFLSQIKSFPAEIRTKYFEVIMTFCVKPSIDLQRYLAEHRITFTSSKYIVLAPKHTITNSAYKCIGFRQIWDDCESNYKPFVTNINRPPVQLYNELQYLTGTALVLLQNKSSVLYSDVLIDQLIEHATTAPIEFVEEHAQVLNNALEALTILKEKYDGYIQIRSSQTANT